jgi:peptidoglycan/xylan/chitin deacetylase (PgdA/CDA1 family)
MKNILKQVIFSLCVILGMTNYFRRIHQNKFIILMYHGVVKTPLEPFSWTQLAERELEYQLTYLKRHYTILKLSELMHRIQRGLPLPNNTAVITFDDGYKNNFTIAYPLLKRLQIPATIFLVTGCISDQALCWFDILYLGMKGAQQKNLDLRPYGLKLYSLRTSKEKATAEQEIVEYLKSVPYSEKDRLLKEILKLLAVEINENGTPFDLLTWEEIKTMNNDGLIEFGAHTVTHNILSQFDTDGMKKEITGSCKAIEDHLGNKCLWFAYPNGGSQDFNVQVKELLKANGIIFGLSSITGLNGRDEDPFELKRVGVGSDTSPARFKCLVSGLLSHFRNLD